MRCADAIRACELRLVENAGGVFRLENDAGPSCDDILPSHGLSSVEAMRRNSSRRLADPEPRE
jgi:hypothetical protein